MLHYRRHYPDDPLLRVWAGLVLAGQRRHALAAAELTKAIELGCDHWRVSWHLARAARALGQGELERLSLSRVPTSLREAASDLDPLSAIT